jgi:hypothetical protein
MKLKFFLISTLFYLICNCATAQSNYSILFRSTYNENVFNIDEKNGVVFAVGKRNIHDWIPNSFQGIIWKIGINQDTISRSFSWGDTTCVFNFVEIQSENLICVIGKVNLPPDYTHSYTVICKFDSQLNLISKEYINIPLNKLRESLVVRHLDHSYYILGYELDSLNYQTACITKLDSNFHYLNYKTYPYPGRFMDCILDSDSSHLLAFTYGMTLSKDEMITLDFELNIVETKIFPYFNQNWNVIVYYSNNMTVKMFSDSSFLVGCNHWRSYDNIDQYDIGFSILKNSLDRVPINYIGAVDTVDYASFGRTFDFINTDNIYYAGTKNNIIDYFPQEPSWILTGKLNSNLQINYERLYGGDANYKVVDLKCTSDGGYIIGAIRFDYLTQNNEWDVVFYKLNHDGLITNAQNNLYPDLNLNLYPNPVTDGFNIDLPESGTMELFSILNQKVLELQVNKGLIYSDISTLNPGFYLLKYTSKHFNASKLIIKH